jgi:hypothetical protein
VRTVPIREACVVCHVSNLEVEPRPHGDQDVDSDLLSPPVQEHQ